jgi:site-specific DNA recombinase
MERLDEVVWNDVSSLLADPARIRAEFERQRSQPSPQESRRLEEIDREVAKVKRGMSRMLDLYQAGDLDKAEFEPRYRRGRQRLAQLESEAAALVERHSESEGLEQLLGSFEQYADCVRQGMNSADWALRREVIRTLVKRVEINEGDIHIVYRIGEGTASVKPKQRILQDCLPRGRSSR